MHKKIIMACMAVAAFAAFVVPASASAAELTHPTGTPIPVGTKLTATNVGITKMFLSSGGAVECSTASMTGTLTKAGAEPEGTIETASFTGTGKEGDCTSPLGDVKVTTSFAAGNGTPYCIKLDNNEAMDATIRGNSCDKAARSITFGFDVTSLGIECKYERTTITGPVTATYTTDTPGVQDAVAHAVKSAATKFVRADNSSVFCPESGELEMTFTLETHKTTAEPIYIS